MLCCLLASLFAFIAYFIFELTSEYHLVWQNTASSSYTCCLSYFPNMPAFMLSLGIVLNLNKWIHYLLKILVFVRVENQLEKSRHGTIESSRASARMSASYMSSTMGSQQTFVSVQSIANKQSRYMCASRFVHIVTLSLVLILNVLFWTQTTMRCVGNQPSRFSLSDLFTYLFTLLGIVFIITGITMALALKKYYTDFYKEYGCLIWVATLCLAVPLFMRGLNSYLYGKEQDYYKYYLDHFALMNSTYIFFSSIIPIVA